MSLDEVKRWAALTLHSGLAKPPASHPKGQRYAMTLLVQQARLQRLSALTAAGSSPGGLVGPAGNARLHGHSVSHCQVCDALSQLHNGAAGEDATCEQPKVSAGQALGSAAGLACCKEPYFHMSWLLSPCKTQVGQQPWSLHVLKAEPMLSAGLAGQARALEAVRSVVLVLARACSAPQCASAPRGEGPARWPPQ